MAKYPTQVRRREYDGKYLRWQLMSQSQLGLQEPDAPHCFDHKLWVVTGVFDTRKEAFGK
jgi:hypothetical protein